MDKVYPELEITVSTDFDLSRIKFFFAAAFSLRHKLLSFIQLQLFLDFFNFCLAFVRYIDYS